MFEIKMNICQLLQTCIVASCHKVINLLVDPYKSNYVHGSRNFSMAMNNFQCLFVYKPHIKDGYSKGMYFMYAFDEELEIIYK